MRAVFANMFGKLYTIKEERILEERIKVDLELEKEDDPWQD